MDARKRQTIQELADFLRSLLKLQSPIDLKALIASFGGEYKEEDLPPHFDGKIEKKDNSFLITVNSGKPDLRKNFTIAHEIGHLFIHMGYILNPDLWSRVDNYEDSVYYRSGYTEEELEANQFAAALLMPEEEFLREVRKNTHAGACSISPISEYFKVSDEAVVTRGKWLGVFSWE
ncbi:ImmA/IrrE family metallo-endopeptidase [Leptospira koniambonensis]|uniref:ImmA/IrrE family metallo-endopeptidase n=1 Tax=Leptospira koniambonensis TaxID=2484950 RepID=A0A4R9J8B2_9LEPT|nr:ImmA/IrrE family metallo-endopeptidase [Leptospira koniambonensis]TGL34102.1 ImmA/IrrE family metallo-endopeptidase [Leptospira koniambonensis]